MKGLIAGSFQFVKSKILLPGREKVAAKRTDEGVALMRGCKILALRG